MGAGMDLAANQSGTPDFYAVGRLRARVAELEVEVNLLHRQRHAAQEDAANARLLAEVLRLSRGEIDRLRARVAEMEKQPRANELRALRNLFAAAGRTIHTASAGGRATLEEINDAWADVCAANVANRALPASRVLGDGEAAVDEEELAALRCLDDAVTINGDGMSTEALGVDWEVARSAKRRLSDIRAAKGGEA